MSVNRLFDFMFVPLRGLPVAISLAIVSLVTVAIVLGVFKLVANQAGLRATRRQLYADLLEIRLFSADPRMMWPGVVNVLWHQAVFLRLSFGPTLLSALPLALLFGQLQAYFGYTSRPINEPMLLTTQVDKDFRGTVTLDVPDGIVLSAAAVHFPQLHQTVWRLTTKRRGAYVVTVHVGAALYQKTLDASGDELTRRSPIRERATLFSLVTSPSEIPIERGSPAASIHVDYTSRRIHLGGYTVPWFVVYFLECAGLALAFGRVIDVTF
jgi:hypothetical protein